MLRQYIVTVLEIEYAASISTLSALHYDQDNQLEGGDVLWRQGYSAVGAVCICFRCAARTVHLLLDVMHEAMPRGRRARRTRESCRGCLCRSAQLITRLAQGLDIRYGQVVTAVDYAEENLVKVTTSNRRTYTANYVICTLPLG